MSEFWQQRLFTFKTQFVFQTISFISFSFFYFRISQSKGLILQYSVYVVKQFISNNAQQNCSNPNSESVNTEISMCSDTSHFIDGNNLKYSKCIFIYTVLLY
jgi:hypothetical protein